MTVDELESIAIHHKKSSMDNCRINRYNLYKTLSPCNCYRTLYPEVDLRKKGPGFRTSGSWVLKAQVKCMRKKTEEIHQNGPIYGSRLYFEVCFLFIQSLVFCSKHYHRSLDVNERRSHSDERNMK